MAGVSHHKQAEIFDRLEIADRLAGDGVRVLFRPVKQILSGPILHRLEHLEDSHVIADDVKVAVVNQDLKIV